MWELCQLSHLTPPGRGFWVYFPKCQTIVDERNLLRIISVWRILLICTDRQTDNIKSIHVSWRRDIRIWGKQDSSENTQQAVSCWAAQCEMNRNLVVNSLRWRHIRVETLPSMQHVKALHSCDLTPHNKNHLPDEKKRQGTERGGGQAGRRARMENIKIKL